MKRSITDLPVVMENSQATLREAVWGGMACTYAQIGAGTDLTPLFEGLPDDLCPCPHWGYVLKGAIMVRYTDGREEALEPGDLFFLPTGHTAWCDVDSAFVEFSPEDEHNEVVAHIGRKLGSS